MNRTDLYSDISITKEIESHQGTTSWKEHLYQSHYKTLANTIADNLLNIKAISNELEKMINRTLDVFISIFDHGRYRSYFDYLFTDRNNTIAYYLNGIARIICIETMGQNKSLFQSFVSELVKTEITDRKWISFFIKKGCDEDQARDLFQNSFLVLNTVIQTETPENYCLNKLPTFKGLANLSSYLYAIGKNKWRDELKKMDKYKKEEEMEIHDAFQKDIMDAIILEEQYEQDLKLLNKLGEKCKEVLLLLAQGFTLNESLSVLRSKGIYFESENALKQQRHRCKKNLMNLL